MRRTEFWARLDRALGPAYSRTWAREQVLAGLGDRTVEQALADGYDVKTIWRQVWEALELPAHER